MNAPSTHVRARRRPALSTIAGLSFALAFSAELIRSGDLTESPTYDALLSEPGYMCAPAVAGRPPLLQNLILAQTETKPFNPQPMKAAGGDVPLYDNLGTLSFKVGTS